MIYNPLLVHKKDKLSAERTELTGEKKRMEALLTSLGIPASSIRKSGHKIDPDKLAVRTKAVMRIGEIESRVSEINAVIDTIKKEMNGETQKNVSKILREIFSKAQLKQIGDEATNRMNPEYVPCSMSFSIKEGEQFKYKMYEYRKLAQDQMEKMIQFRIVLTRIIEQGCEQFGNAEFLKVISPLNKLIIPLKELEKIKKDHLL